MIGYRKITCYKYNADGIRTSKTVNGVTTKYTLDGSNVVVETNGTDTIWYYYDATGALTGFELNGTAYFYVKNTQGDIVAIVNSSGTKVVEYLYDSWGKLVNTTGSLASTVGAKNPYRYRGYRYDAETGLYYLQSRYYDPVVKRFINADELTSTGQGTIGNNMFVYCGSNPIARSDSRGFFWHLVIGGVVGGIIGGISSALSGGDVTDILISVASGADSGVLAASGAGVLAQSLGSAALSMASNAAQQMNHIIKDETGETKFRVGDMLFDGFVGLVCGARGGNGASYGNTAGINSAWKQLSKRGIFNKKAQVYFAKTAHGKGGKFVLDALAESQKISTIGTVIITVKNILVEKYHV